MSGVPKAGMAVACVGAIALSAGAMYSAQRNVKQREGRASIHGNAGNTGHIPGGRTEPMSSADVEAVVSKNRTRAIGPR